MRFGIHPSFSPSVLEAETKGAATIEPGAVLRRRSAYYDTRDLRLARFGVTLRQEVGDDRSGWVVKLPHLDEDLIVDAEARLMPARARELVTAFARGAPLGAVGTLQTHERTWILRRNAGGGAVELADSEISLIRKGRVAARLRELELDEGPGSPGDLEDLAAALRRAGAVDAEPISMMTRALGPGAEAPPDVPEPGAVTGSVAAQTVVRAAVASGTRRILLNDPGTRLGDAEALHQMRVGTRRLRSDLGTFEGLVERAWADALGAELRWLGASLGGVRDLDVLSHRLSTEAQEAGSTDALAPLFDDLRSRRERERAGLLEALSSRRYVTLLDSLVTAAAAPSTTKKAARDARRVLPKLVRGRYEKLAKSVRALDDRAPAGAWHRSRIHAKHLRYAAEAVAPALGPDPKAALRVARRAAKVQDLLGTLQDSARATEVLLDCAAHHEGKKDLNLALGGLIETENRLAEHTRASFRRQWDKIDLEKNVRRLPR